MTPAYTFSVHQSRNKEWFWRCVHRNGREIARSSETYRRRIDCKRGLDRMLVAIEVKNFVITGDTKTA